MSHVFELRLRTARQMNQRLNPLALAVRTVHPRPLPPTSLQEAVAAASSEIARRATGWRAAPVLSITA